MTMGRGGGFGYPSTPGSQYVPNRLAQMLAQNNYNNGSQMGGLAHALQQGLMGLMMRDDKLAQQKDMADQSAAMQAMTQGMAARQWEVPDGAIRYGSPEGEWISRQDAMENAAPAGGYEGGIASLQNLPENQYAGRLTQDLLMKQAERKMSIEDEARKNANALYGYREKKKIDQEFPGPAKPGDVPMNVREWEYYQKLPPEKQQEFLRMKRADKPMDLGDRFIVPNMQDPASPPAATFEKSLKPGERPEVKGAQKAAEIGAANAAKDAEAMPGQRRALENEIAQLPALRQTVDEIKELGKSWFTGGGVGQATGWSASSPQYALNARAERIKSLIGLDKLVEVKKAGGTFGALDRSELNLLINSVVALDPLLDTFPRDVEKVVDLYERALEGRAEDFSKKYPDQQLPKGGRATDSLPPDVTEEDIIETMRANNMTRKQVIDRLLKVK